MKTGNGVLARCVLLLFLPVAVHAANGASGPHTPAANAGPHARITPCSVKIVAAFMQENDIPAWK